MDAETLWAKVFVAAIGGACSDPECGPPDTITAYAAKVADSAVEVATERGIVVADVAAES